jgi:para-aminobenzoate synthetase component I
MNLHSFSGKSTVIRLMNEYGKKKKPFIFIIDFSMENSVVCPVDSIQENEILYNINGVCNYTEKIPTETAQLIFEKFPISFEEYEYRFRKVMQELKIGNTYLLNLTCPTPISINLSLKEIAERSRAKYKLWVRDQFVVFSPETFVTIQNGIISSFPMKGTIDATLPDASATLLSDPKEIAEHYTIVDLIRNDLSCVSKKVRVKEFRYIERLETNSGALLQASSKVSGELPANYHEEIGNIIFKLLPAGSISGAPKERTIKIIQETENYDRGFYSGIFGYFDGATLDSGVMIRFIESAASGMIYKSGGGITAFSNPWNEYREMIDKVYVPFV